jgi:hypothetical protein
VSLPALAYRALRRHRRGTLVIQDVGEDTLDVQVLRPDLTLPELRSRLRRLPLLTYATARLALWVVVPWVALYLLIFGARRLLSRELALDVDTLYTDPSSGSRWDAIDRVVLDDRDALLVDALSNIHRRRCEEPIDVAVIYGAAHMPAVIYGLLARHGYRARTAQWVTVFDIDD